VSNAQSNVKDVNGITIHVIATRLSRHIATKIFRITASLFPT